MFLIVVATTNAVGLQYNNNTYLIMMREVLMSQAAIVQQRLFDNANLMPETIAVVAENSARVIRQLDSQPVGV